MSNYILNGKTLVLNGKKIKFKSDIFMFIEMDNYILITLRDMTNTPVQQPWNNILAIDCQGNIVWHIEDIIHEAFCGGISGLYENKYLIVYNALGIYYKIDINKRTILRQQGFAFGAPSDWGR